MDNSYDVLIIGAGPAGLQAALTAIHHGLKVAVIEKRTDVSRITRSCCQLFIMDDGYENECLQIEQGKVIFTQNGFNVDYDGPTVPVTDKYYLSPKGHKIRFAHQDKSPIAMRFDKGRLLQGIWQQCAALGVRLYNGTVAYDVSENAAELTVKVVRDEIKSTLKAKKLIVADSANSLIAEALGMNRDRTFYSIARIIIYTLEGVQDYEPTVVQNCNGLVYHSKRPVLMTPSILGADTMDLLIPGVKNDPLEQIYNNFTTKSPLAYMFAKAKIVARTGCGLKAYSAMKVPYRDNVLVIGDAAAYVEVETQGALMCGFQAGNAVLKELQGEGGFAAYTRWWQNSFEFNSNEYLRVAQGYALVPIYSDDELDYLFALTEDEVLEGTYSQYKTPKLMWGSILRHKDRIAKERPEIYAKIKNLDKMTL